MSVVIFVKDARGRADLEGMIRELAQRGARLEVLLAGSAGLSAASLPGVACMLARHGVVVIAGCPAPVEGTCSPPWIEISSSDAAASAKLQSILRDLELKGLVPPPVSDVSAEEEALIRERLEKLGYL